MSAKQTNEAIIVNPAQLAITAPNLTSSTIKRTQLDQFELGMLFSEYKAIKADPQASNGAIKALASKYKVHPKSIPRIIANIHKYRDKNRVIKRGRKSIMNLKVRNALHRIAQSNQFKLSARELSKRLQRKSTIKSPPSERTVQRYVKANQWRRVRTRAIPVLKEEQSWLV